MTCTTPGCGHRRTPGSALCSRCWDDLHNHAGRKIKRGIGFVHKEGPMQGSNGAKTP